MVWGRRDTAVCVSAAGARKRASVLHVLLLGRQGYSIERLILLHMRAREGVLTYFDTTRFV